MECCQSCRRAMLSILVLTTLLAFIGSIAEASDVLSVSSCHHDGIMSLQCSPGSLIRVFNVTYGLSQSNECYHQPGDCTLTEQTSFGCNGRNQCDIAIMQQTKYYSRLPKCNLVGNYLRVSYECVKQTDIADICTASRTDPIATEGYIASPFLSSGNYFESLDCKFEIIGSNIQLHLITVNLTDQRDCLEIHNTLSTKTFCGGSGVVENYDVSYVPTSRIQLSFSTNTHGHFGGVWIYYTLTPLPIPVERPTVPPTTEETTAKSQVIIDNTPRPSTHRRPNNVRSTLKPRQTWTAAVLEGDGDILIYNNVSTHLPASTLATILGLIFGLFGLLIIVLFSIYFVKRYRDHRRKRSRRRSAGSPGMDHVMWHNVTNECLSSILQKHDTQIAQGYSNNVMTKEDNSSREQQQQQQQYYKQIENSFC